MKWTKQEKKEQGTGGKEEIVKAEGGVRKERKAEELGKERRSSRCGLT